MLLAVDEAVAAAETFYNTARTLALEARYVGRFFMRSLLTVITTLELDRRLCL